MLTGVAAPLPMINVDTDEIIPKQFLKTIKRTGLGKRLFDECASTTDGTREARLRAQPAGLRKARDPASPATNFGCGSSREHAPWALLDFGIRCVIAPSFADIFFNNCFKNGLLPIVLPQDRGRRADGRCERGANARAHDRSGEARRSRGPDGGAIQFDIDPFRKHCLLNGLDDIGLTLREGDKIDAFEARQHGAASPGSALPSPVNAATAAGTRRLIAWPPTGRS